MYKPDDEILEQANDQTETTVENDNAEPATPIDPPIEEAAETLIEEEE